MNDIERVKKIDEWIKETEKKLKETQSKNVKFYLEGKLTALNSVKVLICIT